MSARRSHIQLPVTQWFSRGWAVQWRRGRPHQDTYEITHKGQFVACVVVTRAGWKWQAPNPRSRALLPPWVWSTETYETWQEAVTGFAKRCRRRDTGRDADLPDHWYRDLRRPVRPKPWTPRPLFDDFPARDRAHREER